MKTTFTLTDKQVNTIAAIGGLIIMAIVIYALCVGSVSNLSSTYLG